MVTADPFLSRYDRRKTTKFWPLIATLEGELTDTEWWRILRRLELARQLKEARAEAFIYGLEIAYKDLTGIK